MDDVIRSPISTRRAVFLDRDGVINRMVYHDEFGLVDSPQIAEEFELLPGVGQAVRRINDMGLLVIVVSNQPGIAKGKCTPADLAAVTAKMHADLAAAGARLDAVYYCLHHPEALRAEYRTVCACRKPRPGLLQRAAREHGIDLSASFIAGDGLTDVLAGRAVGCTTLFLGTRKCEVCRVMDEQGAKPDFIVSDLIEAAECIRRLVSTSKEVTCADLSRHDQVG